MTEATVLELGRAIEHAPVPRRRMQPLTIVVVLVVVAALAVLAQVAIGPGFGGILEGLGIGGGAKPTEVAIRPTAKQKQIVANLTVDDEAQIVVAGRAAEERNAAIPVSALPLQKVRSFLLASAGTAGAARTAMTCLTQAVYYEAGYEPEAGKRAVAQVILNRMRHPAYPKSVCGVVYQGSERRTGCQFSFTCDGSLLRAPGAAAWRSAQDVARQALAGRVEQSVGTATHYHANYVLPKWAFQLAKIEQIGAHIFYRFRGGWGNASAFGGAYSGSEYIPSVNYDALRDRQSPGVVSPVQGEILTDGLTVAPHVTDRHDPRDVGGRINVTKLWRMTIPTPNEAGGGYRAMLDQQGAAEEKPLPVSNSAASALPTP